MSGPRLLRAGALAARRRSSAVQAAGSGARRARCQASASSPRSAASEGRSDGGTGAGTAAGRTRSAARGPIPPRAPRVRAAAPVAQARAVPVTARSSTAATAARSGGPTCSSGGSRRAMRRGSWLSPPRISRCGMSPPASTPFQKDRIASGGLASEVEAVPVPGGVAAQVRASGTPGCSAAISACTRRASSGASPAGRQAMSVIAPGRSIRARSEASGKAWASIASASAISGRCARGGRVSANEISSSSGVMVSRSSISPMRPSTRASKTASGISGGGRGAASMRRAAVWKRVSQSDMAGPPVIGGKGRGGASTSLCERARPATGSGKGAGAQRPDGASVPGSSGGVSSAAVGSGAAVGSDASSVTASASSRASISARSAGR